MISRLYARLLADSEGARGPDGFLSYRAETHALLVGFAVAVLAVASGELMILGAVLVWAIVPKKEPVDLPYSEQLKKEVLYLLGGCVLGAPWGAALAYLLP